MQVKDGRWTIKQIDDTLTFDKGESSYLPTWKRSIPIKRIVSRIDVEVSEKGQGQTSQLGLSGLRHGMCVRTMEEGPHQASPPPHTRAGFYVLLRALQMLKAKNDGAILVGACSFVLLCRSQNGSAGSRSAAFVGAQEKAMLARPSKL